MQKKMFRLNDRVIKRRDELLAKTLGQVLTAFAQRQDNLTRCFLPSQGIEFKELLEGLLSNEEKRFLVEKLRDRGFRVMFRDEVTPAHKGRSYTTPEKRTTSMLIISRNLDNINQSSLSRARGFYECLNALEWHQQQEQYAFSWLFGTLSERVESCTTGHELFEFDLFIPLHFDSKVEYSNDARFEQRSRLFRAPISWANLLSCYRLELKDYATIRVCYKLPHEVEQAEILHSAVLFSSLLCINRIGDEAKVDWRRLPDTAFELIFTCLLGKNLQTKLYLASRVLQLPQDVPIPESA